MDNPVQPGQAKAVFRRIFLSRTFMVLAALLVLYTAAGFFLLPYVIKQQAIQYAAQTLQRLRS